MIGCTTFVMHLGGLNRSLGQCKKPRSWYNCSLGWTRIFMSNSCGCTYWKPSATKISFCLEKTFSKQKEIFFHQMASLKQERWFLPCVWSKYICPLEINGAPQAAGATLCDANTPIGKILPRLVCRTAPCFAPVCYSVQAFDNLHVARLHLCQS